MISLRNLIMFILLLLITSSCQTTAQKEDNKTGLESKNVITILVDSMTGDLIDKSLKTNNFPALSFLINNGHYYDDFIAPFPSMSVSIEATLMTGEMPKDHQIPGLTWYNLAEDRIIDYGTSIETIRKLGIINTLKDGLFHLNNTHLNKDSSTIFEELQDEGISTGSINMLVYRGREKQTLKTPFIISRTTGFAKEIVVSGPDLHAFGTFKRPKELRNSFLPDQLLFRGGFTDNYAADVITKLIKQKQQPKFLLVFFPEMDKKTHKHGPDYVKGFEEVDKHLQQILNTYDSWESALSENIFIIAGDHGQVQLKEDETKVKVNLHTLLKEYKVAKFTEKPSSGDIVISNNHRMAFITPVKDHVKKIDLIKETLQDQRIFIAASLDNDWVTVWSPQYSRSFKYKEGGEWTDEYQQSWSIEGDSQLLHLKTDTRSKKITFTDYPDALNQLNSALNSHPSSIVITAKPGYLIYSETTPVHNGGGEHGGMHQNDTAAALIISGTDKLPEFRRMMDLKDYILSLFN